MSLMQRFGRNFQ